MQRHYEKVDDIYADIVDLAGVRVALYFPAERAQVGRLISDLFVVRGEPKEFPDGSKPPYEKRFSGYGATHFHVFLRESSLSEAQKRFAQALVEIEVASVLMHAWAEVEHDLVYKPLQGALSEDEYAILDELNGLVLSGEIALERLQRAGEARVAARGRKFNNHYDLAAYLLDRAAPLLRGPAPDTALGRIDLLFELLSQLNLATPEQLDIYIQDLSSDIERRPLAEQIVDHLLEEDPSRYALYNSIRSTRDVQSTIPQEQASDEDLYESIGAFLTKWWDFETSMRGLRQFTSNEQHDFIPTIKALNILEMGQSTRMDYERIRRVRNRLVHGRAVPTADEIKEATQRLEELLPELNRAIENKRAQVAQSAEGQ